MDGYLMIGTEIDTKEFDSQIKYIETKLEEIEYQLKQADMGFDVGDTIKLEAQYEKLTNQLIKLKQKQEDLNKTDLSNIEFQLNKVSKTSSNVIKKVSKWALAIFGVRAAYGFVRNAVSTLAQYNEQLATDLEYIRFAIATSLEPLIEKIVLLVYRLLTYVNFLAKAWFGIDLFANASAAAMNKSVKAAKEMKKSLAGFDEMNLVSGGVSDASAGGSPSVDLSSFENIETPRWLEMVKEIGQWIIDNWQTVLEFIFLTKSVLDLVMGNWVGLVIDLVAFIILGLVQLWKELQELRDNLTILFTFLYIFIKDDIVKPISDFFHNLWNDIKKGAISFWEGTKNVFSTIGNWIYGNIIKPVSDFFVGLWNGIVNGVTKATTTIKNIFNSVVNFFKNIINTIVGLFKTIGIKVGDVVGTAFKNVINGVLSAIENILNFPIKSINKLLDVINEVPGINLGKLGTFNLPRLKSGGIINMPGKGIPIGGAIGGEAGREGVLPLTDSQAMEELGSAIGRYITINLTNNTNLDGRTIARQQSKVQANKNFAMNR